MFVGNSRVGPKCPLGLSDETRFWCGISNGVQSQWNLILLSKPFWTNGDQRMLSTISSGVNFRRLMTVCRSEMSLGTFGHQMLDSLAIGGTYPTYADVKLG